MQRKFALRVLWLAVVGICAVLSAGCGGRDDAETEIRETIAAAEAAASGKDVRSLRGMVSDDYADADGRDHDAVVNLLRAMVLSRQQLYLYTRIRDIRIPASGHARIVVVVAMAGRPIASADALADLRADIVRLELDLVRSRGQWRVIAAEWERAGLADLL